MKQRHFLRSTAALALSIVSGCGFGAPPEDDALSTPVAPKARSAKEGPDKAAAPEKKATGTAKAAVLPVDLPAVTERSALLQRLPKSALFVLRLPHVEKLTEAWRRSALSALMHSPEGAAQAQRLEEHAARVEGLMREALPDYDALREQALSIEGESVLALVSVDMASFSDKSANPNEMPFHLAWMFDAGKHASEMDALAERVLKEIESRQSASNDAELKVVREKLGAQSWRARVTGDGIEFDLLREGGQFVLDIGPKLATTSHEHALATREIEDSFLAADITRGTKDLSRGRNDVVIEAFVNLVPVWNAVELLAPADVKKVLNSSGATAIRGLSSVAALGQTGIDEEVFLMSPGGTDLLTRCVTNRPLEAAIARYLPEDSGSATMYSFDFTALLEGLTKVLPDSAKRDLNNALLDFKKGGLDVRADLIENIGPTFAITGDFDPARMFQNDGAGGAPDFTIVAQLADGSRLRALIDVLLKRTGGRDSIHTKDVHGFKVYSTGAVPLPGPDGNTALILDPHWYIGDDAIVFSLSRPALARALAATWKADNRGPRALGAALERETGAFAIGVNASEGQVAPATTIGRRTSLGLEFSMNEGAGTATGYSFVACAGIAAAVAIPTLFAERQEARERAVLATLRSIATAEKTFRARRLMDDDEDGEGEFATLSELSGTSALRNGASALVPPLLPAGMVPGADGLMRRNGYVFRVDLSNRLTRRIDFDEKEFFVYAWPAEASELPNSVYSIDAEGTVRYTDNDGAEQNYAGIERMPRTDAARRVNAGNPKVLGPIPRSVDGGLWRDL